MASEMSIISDSAKEDHDLATADSFKRVRGQLDINVTENVDQELDRVQGFACDCRFIDGGPCCCQFTDEDC